MTAVFIDDGLADRIPLREIQARDALLGHGVPEGVIEEINSSDHCSYWNLLQELTALRDRGYTWPSIIHFQLGDCLGGRTRGMRPIDRHIHGRRL